MYSPFCTVGCRQVLLGETSCFCFFANVFFILYPQQTRVVCMGAWTKTKSTLLPSPPGYEPVSTLKPGTDHVRVHSARGVCKTPSFSILAEKHCSSLSAQII